MKQIQEFPYGVDEKSYESLTTIKKSYAIVKRNV